jgi:hypothetical protein
VLPLETLIRNPPVVIFMPTHKGGSDIRDMRARQKLLAYFSQVNARQLLDEFPWINL